MEQKLVMNTHKFSDKYAIFNFDFLTRYVEETDKLAMSEEQDYVILPKFLTNPVAAQFRDVKAR